MPVGRWVMYFVAHWRNWIAVIGLLLSGLITATAYFAPVVTGQIEPRGIRHDGGVAYVAGVPRMRGRVYQLKHDWISNAKASRLRLFEDRKPLGPAHAAHVDVRQLGAGRYVHWGTEIWFSASDGTDPRANGRSYEYRSRLSIKPLWTSVGVVSLVVALFVLIVTLPCEVGRKSRQRSVLHKVVMLQAPITTALSRRSAHFCTTIRRVWRKHGILLVRTPVLAARALAYLSLVGCGVLLIAAVYALFNGWALPTAAPIRWFPVAAWAAEHEPIFHVLLLSFVVLGATMSWVGRFLFRSTSALRRDEILLARFLQRWGICLAIVLFVFFISATWAGLARPGDPHWGSIGGLIPFSDANGYFAGAHDQAKDGEWNAISLRRPLAAAFRSSLMFFAGFSYATTLLLQAALLACAAYAGARAVGGWRGIYAGLAFFALSYVAVRTFLPTFLTEPLGLFWALLAIPFFVRALRDGSLQDALIGLAMTTVALFMRPGSVFTIAALCLWLVWRFGRNPVQKVRAGIYAVAIVLSVAVAGFLLQRAYGIGSDLSGSNFSYVLCGLSIGTDWSGCPNRYEEVKALGSEKSVTDFLYRKALDNIIARPAIILERLYYSANSFMADVPAILWRGYAWSGDDYSTLKVWFFSFAGLGLGYVALYRRERDELLFWLLIWASVAASAAFVHFDDGRRVMTASYPLLLMFLASGLLTRSVPIRRIANTDRLTLAGWAGLLCAGILLFAIPWLAHRTSPAPDLRRSLATPLKPNEHVVFGGRRVTGMLVVADAAPLGPDIPTLNISRFAEFIKLSNVEFYQGLLNPQAPKVPFGFISAPRIENGAGSNYQYIVPAEVMQRRDVKAWSFQVREWNRKEPYGPYWFFVERADELK